MKNNLKIFSDAELSNRNKGLQEIKTVLDESKTPFMLFDGALLGAVREKNFIRWDWDVELSFKTEELFFKEKIICQRLRDLGFMVTVSGPLFTNFKINAFKYGTKYSLIGFIEKDGLRIRQKWQYPREFFENIQEIFFLGAKYRCPSPPEKYLEFQYGDWNKPAKERRANRYLNRRIYRTTEFRDHFNRVLGAAKKSAEYIYDPLLLNRQFKRENNFLTMLESVPPDNLNFIDVGSNDASESIYLLKKNLRNFHCYLIEPDPKAFEIVRQRINRFCPLQKNIVKFFNIGISNKIGLKEIYTFPKDSHLNSVEKRSEAQIETPVWFTTLNDFIQDENIGAPLLIKMDIEGHEVEALQGFSENAIKMKPIYILLEVHPREYNDNHSLHKVLEYYFNNGFRTILLETAGLAIPDLFKEKGYKPFKISNNLMTYPRGLYRNVPNDFVLKTACHSINNTIPQRPYITTKIVRSLLISNA